MVHNQITDLCFHKITAFMAVIANFVFVLPHLLVFEETDRNCEMIESFEDFF